MLRRLRSIDPPNPCPGCGSADQTTTILSDGCNMAYVLIWLITLLIGCASPTQYQWTTTPTAQGDRVRVVRVDDGFSRQEQAQVIEGIGTWNRALNGQLRLVPDTSTFDLLKAVREDGTILTLKVLPEYDWVSTRACGWASDPGVGARMVYVVVGRAGCPSIRDTVIHELGHALNARHGTGVMSEPPEGDCPTRETMEQVSRSQGLAADGLNYCEVVK
jgi:hypothetical protein